MGTDHVQVGSDLQTRLRVLATRWGLAAAGWVLYILSYGGIHASLGPHTALAALVPVVVTAWRGAVPGSLAGVAAVPLTALIAVARGDSLWTSSSAPPHS